MPVRLPFFVLQLIFARARVTGKSCTSAGISLCIAKMLQNTGRIPITVHIILETVIALQLLLLCWIRAKNSAVIMHFGFVFPPTTTTFQQFGLFAL